MNKKNNLVNKNILNLIYEENGGGKSTYYKNKLESTKYISFNYDLEKWYDDETKTFSQFNINGKKLQKNILEMYKNFFEDIRREFDITNITAKKLSETFNVIIKNISDYKDEKYPIFLYKKSLDEIDEVISCIDNWENIQKETKSCFEFSLIEVYSYLETYLEYNDYKWIFDELFMDDHIFWDICVYINLFSYTEEQFLENNKWNREILNIKNSLGELFKVHILKASNNTIDESKINKITKTISKINLNILNQVYRTSNSENSQYEMNKFAFNWIVNSKTFNNLKIKIQEYLELKKLCFKFDEFNINDINFISSQLSIDIKEKLKKIKNNIKISEDKIRIEGLDLAFEGLSNGEKLITIFILFLPIFFKSNKVIILDDVFEKLDIHNCSILIIVIYEELQKINPNINKKIEILTHDINLVNLFVNIYYENIDDYLDDKKFELYFPRLDNNFENLIEKQNTNFIFSFENLLFNLSRSLKHKVIDKHTHNENEIIINFCKYFNRKNISNNWIQTPLYNKKAENSISVKIYNYISENIFHYSPNIVSTINDQIELKNIFYELDINNENNILNGMKSITTKDFYNNLINKIKKLDKKDMFGINLTKLKNDIEKMLEFITIEEKIYKSHIKEYSNKTESAYQFYKKFWKEKYPNEYEERKIKFHSFERSLSKYRN